MIAFGNRIKLHQLRDLIAIAEKGSLRAAARELGLSQSAMTKSIQALEREIGTPLFERQRRGAVLTPLGALFLQRARAVANEVMRAKEEIQQHMGAGSGTVTACLSTVPYLALLPTITRPFLKRYPDVHLTVLEGLGFSAVEPQLRDGSVDFYIGVEAPEAVLTGFIFERLTTNERFVVCRKGHPLASVTRLADLVDARWALGGAGGTAAPVETLFSRHGLPIPTKLTFGGSVLGQMIFVLHSDMLALAPRQWLDFAPMKDGFERILIRETVEAPSVSLVRRAALPLTPAAEHFCDLARNAFAA